MTGAIAFYVVDRVESGVAVLERDDGVMAEVPRRQLPAGAGEGSVLRVSHSAAGEPDWASAVVDEAERAARVKRAAERLERLKGRDPGGDVVIS
jgi:hypothetical protein